ncbi:MAG: Ig-like domain repeat protein [Saprospiraceae bacterium]
MAVLISVNGNSASDGFLVAPVGSTYDADIALWTDSGTAIVTLQAAAPNPAGLVFSTAAAINLSTSPTIVQLHATLQSATRGDTTIEVLDTSLIVVASFTVTSILHPTVHFRGRFEARFATNTFYNQNPIYEDPALSATSEDVGPGWTWALEGEPDFVPSVGNVPEDLEMTGMGRVIRLNNPVALRSHAAAVVSTVDSISGATTLGPETFFTGDPLIGQPVNFGPDTYFAGNKSINAADPDPEEFFGDTVEPMALFELHFGPMFSGASNVGPFTHKATFVNEITRVPDSRPIATGTLNAAAELAEFGLPTLVTFSEARIDLLSNDLLAGGTPQELRNLVRRINHLLQRVSATKRAAIIAAHPAGTFTLIGKEGTLIQGWTSKEVLDGKVDTNLSFNPSGSSVVAYMSEFTSFNIQWIPFAFHSDELCAHHKGSLTHLNPDGSYSTGEPHIRTVDGTYYDFQAAGEFTLLRGGDKMEIQVRQTPVAAANPIADSHSGLPVCVSMNTAVAARVGSHRISLQRGHEGNRLEFYLDGKPTRLSKEGLDLGAHRVTAFDIPSGETGLRVDYEDQTVLTVTPNSWHSLRFLDVSVSNTSAVVGIMGHIPKDSWLPRLRNGATVGPKPASLHDRYIALYKTFADSWRVTDETSLFVYAPGTSTKTFTDHDWPAEKAPCELKPGFQLPEIPILQGMPIDKAKQICSAVTLDDLHNHCVFDVATTGDEFFAQGYLFAQELRLCGTLVQIVGYEPPSQKDRTPVVTPNDPPNRTDQSLLVTATVLPITPGRLTPEGTVIFYVDNKAVSAPVKLDTRGQAKWTIDGLDKGTYNIRATYTPADTKANHSSTSPNLSFTVTESPDRPNKGCLALPWYVWVVLVVIALLVVWFLF